MDKLSVHLRSPRQAKAKKKPIKVVYISNPTRVRATASEFKGVVQQLTGRDSDVADLSKFADVEKLVAAGDICSTTHAGPVGTSVGAGEKNNLRQQRWPWQQWQGSPGETQVDAFDEIFTTKVLEDLAPFMPSSLHDDYPSSVDNVQRWGDDA